MTPSLLHPAAPERQPGPLRTLRCRAVIKPVPGPAVKVTVGWSLPARAREGTIRPLATSTGRSVIPINVDAPRRHRNSTAPVSGLVPSFPTAVASRVGTYCRQNLGVVILNCSHKRQQDLWVAISTARAHSATKSSQKPSNDLQPVPHATSCSCVTTRHHSYPISTDCRYDKWATKSARKDHPNTDATWLICPAEANPTLTSGCRPHPTIRTGSTRSSAAPSPLSSTGPTTSTV